MADTTPFGALGGVPFELRHLIWAKIGPSAAVACLSSAIYQEYQHTTYDNLSIEFSQHSTKQRCATAKTNHGALMESMNASDTSPPNWLQALPWARVKTLVFSLEPPDPEDPGQMIDRWQTTTQLLFMVIGRADPLPPVHIRVKQGIWGQCDTISDISDLETALMPFLGLAAYSHISVSLPETSVLTPSHINKDSMESRVRTLVEEICQGTADIDFREYVDYVLRMRYRQTCELLDNLPGRTASILRRERFANWSRDFEIGYHQVLRHLSHPRDPVTRWRGQGWFPYDLQEFKRRCRDFETLYVEMRAWNPWSIALYQQPHAAAKPTEWQLYNDLHFQHNKRGIEIFFYDGFRRQSWEERYPEGIPPRRSTKYREHFREHGELFFGLPGHRHGVVLTARGILCEDTADEIPPNLGGWDILDDLDAINIRRDLASGIPRH